MVVEGAGEKVVDEGGGGMGMPFVIPDMMLPGIPFGMLPIGTVWVVPSSRT